MDMTVNFVSVAIFPVITSRCKNNNSLGDQTANCLTDGIVLIRVDGRHSQAHVDDSNVVCGPVGSNPIQRAQHRRGRSNTFRVQYTKIDEICVRSNTNKFAAGYATISSSQRGDMCSMPVGICGYTFTGKVFAVDDAYIA